MSEVLDKKQKLALYQTLEFCIDQLNVSQFGYFSPGGWAFEQLVSCLDESSKEKLSERHRNRVDILRAKAQLLWKDYLPKNG